LAEPESAAGTPEETALALPDEGLPELNLRQAAFVREYLIDLNATQAYIRAGYSPRTAGSAAADLRRHPVVAAHIARGMAARAVRAQVTADQVLAEMSLLANSDIGHYVITDEGQVSLAEGAPEGCMRAIAGIKKKTRILRNKDGDEVGREYEVEVKLWDKPQPLKLMGRHVGLFPDKVEIVPPAGLGDGLGDLTNDELAARAEALRAEALALPAVGPQSFIDGEVVSGPGVAH
jgi:phage terminase small subunit